MLGIMRKIWRGIKAVGREFKNIFRDIWKYGIKRDVTKSRGKLVFDVALIIIWIGLVLSQPTSIIVEGIAIGFTGAMITKPFMFRDGISADFLNPIISIAGYTGAYWIWRWYREITMLVAAFSIPRVTHDIAEKTESYFDQLSPC